MGVTEPCHDLSSGGCTGPGVRHGEARPANRQVVPAHRAADELSYPSTIPHGSRRAAQALRGMSAGTDAARQAGRAYGASLVTRGPPIRASHSLPCADTSR